MKAFWKVKRINGVLWVQMYTNCKFPWYAARCPINNRKEAKEVFKEFIKELKCYMYISKNS